MVIPPHQNSKGYYSSTYSSVTSYSCSYLFVEQPFVVVNSETRRKLLDLSCSDALRIALNQLGSQRTRCQARSKGFDSGVL